MAADSLGTLDAILAGLHTLAVDAESVEDEQLRQRLTGAVIGLRAAVLTVRGEVLQLIERHDQLAMQARQQLSPDAHDPAARNKPPRMKWGCYQFDDSEGLFCAACYDGRGRRIRTMRHNSQNLICPNCRTQFPMR